MQPIFKMAFLFPRGGLLIYLCNPISPSSAKTLELQAALPLEYTQLTNPLASSTSDTLTSSLNKYSF